MKHEARLYKEYILATNTSVQAKQLRPGSSYAYSGQLIASRKEHKCGICPQKCCLSCTGKWECLEGREKKINIVFPLFCNWGGGGVGDETSCKCIADYDCLALRYARTTSQSDTFIQTEQQVYLMNFCLELEFDLACSLLPSVCL